MAGLNRFSLLLFATRTVNVRKNVSIDEIISWMILKISRMDVCQACGHPAKNAQMLRQTPLAVPFYPVAFLGKRCQHTMHEDCWRGYLKNLHACPRATCPWGCNVTYFCKQLLDVTRENE